MIEFFGMPIKTLGSLVKIRVGRVTGNTHISFFGLIKGKNDSVLIAIQKEISEEETNKRQSKNELFIKAIKSPTC